MVTSGVTSQMMNLATTKRLRKMCTMSEPQVASVSNEINQERVKKHRNEEFRDIEYYNRTMASLLGRDDHAKTIRVFHSIKEHDPV